MGDIIFCAILVLCISTGIKRGFARSFLSITSTILSMLFSFILYRPVSKMLMESKIGDMIFKSVGEMLNKSVSENAGALGSKLVEMTDSVEIITNLLANAISFAVTLIVIKVIVSVVIRILNLAVKLPVIRQFNSILGGIFGLISGIIICYLIIGISLALEPSGNFLWLTKMVNSSYVASLFCNENLIAELLSKLP